MQRLLVLGLFLALLGVVILGMGTVMQEATALWSLRERSKDAFDYDVQQRRWYARVLLVLGAKLGAKRGARREPPPYRAFPFTVYGFLLLVFGFLLQWLAALGGVIRVPRL